MLTPFKFSFICIGGLPIRMALSNDSTRCTVVSAGRQYQGSVVIIDFDLVHPTLIPIYHFGIGGPPIPENSRHEFWASGRIDGLPTHLEFNEIGVCTYISISGWACSVVDPIFLCPFLPLLSADRSLVSAASLSASFHISTQTLSPPQAQRRLAATQSSCLIFQSLSAPKE